MASAINCFPVPLSPSIRTAASEGPTVLMISMICRSLASRPTMPNVSVSVFEVREGFIVCTSQVFLQSLYTEVVSVFSVGEHLRKSGNLHNQCALFPTRRRNWITVRVQITLAWCLLQVGPTVTSILRRLIMKRVLAVIIMTVFSLPAAAQSQIQPVADDCACESQALPATLAIVNGVSISARDIDKATGDSVRNLQRQVVEARKRELDLLINSKLLAMEAKKRGVSTTKLLETEVVAKVKPPTPIEIRAFYDQNKARINGEFEAVKDDIVGYLTDERQRTQAKNFADGLRAASNTNVKVPQATLPRNESERAQVLATINGEAITAGDVEDSLQALIFDVQEQVYGLRKNEVDLNINDTLLTQEAQKRKITTNALLETEVKPRPITEEQARVFFEQNKERVSGDFAQTKDSIISYLQQVELRLAERAFVDK